MPKQDIKQIREISSLSPKAQEGLNENLDTKYLHITGEVVADTELIDRTYNNNIKAISEFLKLCEVGKCFFVNINNYKVFKKEVKDIRNFDADYLIYANDLKKLKKLKTYLRQYKNCHDLKRISFYINKISDFVEANFRHIKLYWV